MVKYHISPTTGNPNKCYASKKPCPYGGPEEHYPSKEAAREAYEGKQGASFSREDTLLPGMSKGGSAKASQARVAARPQLSFEDRETADGWVTDIYANGEFAFTAVSRSEVAIADRAREAGQWQALREAMEVDDSSCEAVGDLLTYQADELDEELEAREETLAGTKLDPQKPRAYEAALSDVQVGRIAVAIHKAEAKATAANPQNASNQVVATRVREPGEHPYETVAAKDGTKLGTVMLRDGFHIAAVHSGRAPKNVGQFHSHEEALAALVKNKGEGQAQDRF